MLFAWSLLLISVCFEVLGVISMKLSHGFTRKLPSVLIFVFYGIAFFLLTIIVKHIPLSVAYSVWAGLGTALTAIVGVVLFKERMAPMGLLGIAFIACGIIIIKLGSAAL